MFLDGLLEASGKEGNPVVGRGSRFAEIGEELCCVAVKLLYLGAVADKVFNCDSIQVPLIKVLNDF